MRGVQPKAEQEVRERLFAHESNTVVKTPSCHSLEDPLTWLSRLVNKLNSLWLTWTYPFASVGKGLFVHYSCDLRRPVANRIWAGDSVSLGREVWLNVLEKDANTNGPAIILEDGCKIGRRSMISAKNRIYIGQNTILCPSVLVMDHNHAFENVSIPIFQQGVTQGGTIRIEEECSIGFGAAIVCNQGELVIGRNSVLGVNSVVGHSIPPYSVVTGNPARVVKRYDPDRKT
jgi:acetyltransferase-like isoleucine patch superfamily enzyme